MEIQSISLKQFDRSTNKVVDYDKDRDEGVWLRYVASIDLSLLNFSFELKPDKTILTMYQDVKIEILEHVENSKFSILDDIVESPDELIGMFQNEVERMWDTILHAYPATSKDKETFIESIKDAGSIIYNAVKLFYENLDKETIEGIKDKNQIKIQDEEICLNDIVK